MLLDQRLAPFLQPKTTDLVKFIHFVRLFLSLSAAD